MRGRREGAESCVGGRSGSRVECGVKPDQYRRKPVTRSRTRGTHETGIARKNGRDRTDREAPLWLLRWHIVTIIRERLENLELVSCVPSLALLYSRCLSSFTRAPLCALNLIRIRYDLCISDSISFKRVRYSVAEVSSKICYCYVKYITLIIQSSKLIMTFLRRKVNVSEIFATNSD